MRKAFSDYVDALQDVYIIVVDVDTFPRGTLNNRQKKCPYNTETAECEVIYRTYVVLYLLIT